MGDQSSQDVTPGGFSAVVRRAAVEPGFRGKLVWFPGKVIDEYGLGDEEASAVRTGDTTGLQLSDEIRELAISVFDLHDLHAGE
jgi:hypothetical protein